MNVNRWNKCNKIKYWGLLKRPWIHLLYSTYSLGLAETALCYNQGSIIVNFELNCFRTYWAVCSFCRSVTLRVSFCAPTRIGWTGRGALCDPNEECPWGSLVPLVSPVRNNLEDVSPRASDQAKSLKTFGAASRSSSRAATKPTSGARPPR